MHRWRTCCMPSLVESCLLFLRAGLSLVPPFWYFVLLSSPIHFIWVNLNNLFGCSYNLRSISSSATAVIKVNIFSNTCNVLFVRLNYILNHPTLSLFLFGSWSYYSNVNWKLCICHKCEPSISTSRQKICQTSSEPMKHTHVSLTCFLPIQLPIPAYKCNGRSCHVLDLGALSVGNGIWLGQCEGHVCFGGNVSYFMRIYTYF